MAAETATMWSQRVLAVSSRTRAPLLRCRSPCGSPAWDGRGCRPSIWAKPGAADAEALFEATAEIARRERVAFEGVQDKGVLDASIARLVAASGADLLVLGLAHGRTTQWPTECGGGGTGRRGAVPDRDRRRAFGAGLMRTGERDVAAAQPRPCRAVGRPVARRAAEDDAPGELQTFDGSITVDELRRAFPAAAIEDAGALEKVTLIREASFGKRVRERLLPSQEVLAQRLFAQGRSWPICAAT